MGRIKRIIEDALDRMCICDGGCSMDINEHDSDCPCIEFIGSNNIYGELNEDG